MVLPSFSLMLAAVLSIVVSHNQHSCYAFITGEASLSRTTTNRASHSLASSTTISGDEFTNSLSVAPPPPVVAADANHPLIMLANEILYTKSGFYSPYDESVYSEEFVFRGPYIGPLNKEDYLETMDTFGIYKAIPDISPNGK